MIRFRTWTAATALAALVALPAVATAQDQPARRGPIVEAARQVTTGTNPVRLFNSPAIAVHPDDPLTAVVAVGDTRNGGCGLHVTRDGGLSWATTAPNLLPEEFQFCVQRNFGPAMGAAFASDGTLYVAMSASSAADGHPNGPIAALLARTTDLGATHETFVAAPSEPFEFQGATGFEQHRLVNLAVDPTDPETVYLGWRLWINGLQGVEGFPEEDNTSLITVTHDGGRTWSEPVSMLDGFAEADGDIDSDTPMLVVASDGTAYAFTKERPPRSAEDALARIFMAKSTDGGATWETTVAFDGMRALDNPSVAIGPNDELYVTFAGRGDARENPSDVYFMRSVDGGATWTEPVNLTDDDPSRGVSQYFPGISVAPNGRVDVAWYDFRNDPFFKAGEIGNMGSAEGQRYWDVYAAYSADGGETWSENVRVTDRSVDGQVGVTFGNQDIRGPIGVASTNSMAYVTWSDSRAGTPEFEAEDAYFTRLRFDPAAAGSVATSNDEVLWGIVGAGAALALGGLILVLGTRAARRRGAPAAEPAPAPVPRP